MTSPVTQDMHKSRLQLAALSKIKAMTVSIQPWNTDDKQIRTKQNETTYLLLETALNLWILLLHALWEIKLCNNHGFFHHKVHRSKLT